VKVLEHLIDGEIIKGKYVGIHFFQAEHHQIDTIIHEADALGVWEASIVVKHPKTHFWRKKDKPSTFFPITWSKEQLIEKLEQAYGNKKKIYTYKYIGTTNCGIQVAFFIRNETIVSCFPLRNKLE
jgi:hypothetical protein